MIDKSIFKDELLAQNFEEDGYVVIDLFSEDTIKNLKQIYSSVSLKFDKHFYSSSFIEDMELKKQLSQKISGALLPTIQQHFKNYKQLGSVFLVKPPGPDGEMPVHQDWTVVDESKFCSITIWIPLQETLIKNGAIKVLPKSQKLTNALRSPTLNDALSSIKNVCENQLVPLEMEIGQAFVFNHAVLHSSFPNLSNEPRIACAFGLIHEEAELLFYHKRNEKVEVLKISEDFFLNYPKPGERPTNSQLLNEIDYKEESITLQHYNKFYDLPDSRPKNSFWHKLKSLISS